MTTVYVVQGEHQTVPGRALTVHATEASALAEALSLLNLIRSTENLPLLSALPDVAALDKALDEVGAARGEEEEKDRDFDVWITGCELQGEAPPLAMGKVDGQALADAARALAPHFPVEELGPLLAAEESDAERRCPSHHWNNGDDVCADCGRDLS